jgi:uncharacterized protein YjgD (DUF1641 family)
MEQAIAELNQKIDLLSAQVQFLTEQAQAVARGREERAELMRDLVPIANDGFRLAVEQLEEIQGYVDLDDLLRLLKRLLRNGRNIGKILDQVESGMDLLATAGPLTDQAFGWAVELLDQLERKGYFTFARGGARIVDNIVTSFGEEDVRLLGDNIVLVLQTIKEMTQPEVMHFLRNTVAIIDREKDQPVETSLRSLWRQVRDPDVRRGVAISLRVLRSIGRQTQPN